MLRARDAERQSRADAQVSRQALDFVVGLFEAASPESAKGEIVDARQLVDVGIERVRGADLEPLARAEILFTLAEVQANLGDYPDSIELAEEALETRVGLLADDDPAVLASLEQLGNAQRRAGQLDEAAPLLERLVDMTRSRGDELLSADALNSLGPSLEPGTFRRRRTPSPRRAEDPPGATGRRRARRGEQP